MIGMVVLCDMKGYSLGHLAHVNMAMMKKLMPIWEVRSTKSINTQEANEYPIKIT